MATHSSTVIWEIPGRRPEGQDGGDQRATVRGVAESGTTEQLRHRISEQCRYS